MSKLVRTTLVRTTAYPASTVIDISSTRVTLVHEYVTLREICFNVKVCRPLLPSLPAKRRQFMDHRLSEATTAVDIRDAIDERIGTLEDELLILRSHRNSLAPISRLPVELLATIFLHYKILQQKEDNRSRKETHPPNWLAITYVCSRWRQVSITCSCLWTDLVIHRQWTRVMLNRSRSAPLVIHIETALIGLPRPRPPRGMPLVQLALEHVHRARELKLIGYYSILADLLHQLTSPAPLLTYLSLTCYGSRQLLLTEALFGGVTPPGLRVIDLHDCGIQWTSRIFHEGITSLTIMSSPLSQRPTIEQILAGLSKMTQLETLAIDTLPRVPEGTFSLPPLESSSTPVILPVLSHLHLTGRAIECDNLLNHLICPSVSSLVLQCRVEANVNLGISGLFDKITHSFVGSKSPVGNTSPPITCLRLGDIDNTYGLHVEGWSGFESEEAIRRHWDDSVEPLISCHFWWGEVANEHIMTAVSFVSKFMDALRVDEVRVLALYPPYLDTMALDWSSCFHSMKKLRGIYLRELETFMPFMEALSEGLFLHRAGGTPSPPDDSELSTERKEEEILWPHLTIIEIMGVNFSGTMPGSTTSIFQTLQNTLAERANRSMKLRELWITESLIEIGQVDMLREVACQVHSDIN
ncbi:hypothetical protein EW146_g3328 [Bondarzewia mesenterica]|uniref:Uncharacterized protein n=1 Tax=Bondarzewia mesenterica TaxID=1095465 RepID=A0A4S4LZQ0_9AGAM|nr:hypothetical protein EW146_g3328 [Bondarzewia mesenterica]